MTSGAVKMRNLSFISEFLKYPREIGTFTQSSRVLAKKIAREINGSTEVVEFGPGIGAVTVEILRQLPENGRLTCFEINPKFCGYLEKIDDPRLRVINDDANNCKQYIDDLECVISGLPLTLLGKSKIEKILGIICKSKSYIQLQYTPFLGKRMRNYFFEVRLIFVPLNLPPAFVYVCRVPRDGCGQ